MVRLAPSTGRGWKRGGEENGKNSGCAGRRRLARGIPDRCLESAPGSRHEDKGCRGNVRWGVKRRLICMDDLGKAEEIWGNMTYSTVFNVDDSMIGKLKKFGVRSMKVTDAAQNSDGCFQTGGSISPHSKNFWKRRWMRSGSGAHHGISAPRPFQSRTGKRRTSM